MCSIWFSSGELSSLFVILTQISCCICEHLNITSGHKNVTLTCQAPNNNTIIIVEWSRADLGDKYVLLYRNERFDPDNQHPSFKNRVDLKDRQMKDGDVSLILKDVTINDTGTYECRVFLVETRSWEHSIIYLHVDPPGDDEDQGKKSNIFILHLSQ
uniref:Ig-like domain-containing protein n=1 Tax=Oreochromis niloticus TaxID=8128 RepID=A0A669EB94_ORENI